MAHHIIIIKHPSGTQQYSASGSDMDTMIAAVTASSEAPSYLAPALTWTEYGTGSTPSSTGSQITWTNNDLSLEWETDTSDLSSVVSALNASGDTALANSLQALLN
jgi:hypothetical protein